jgi:ABC-type methionine transport system ATPase subunit
VSRLETLDRRLARMTKAQLRDHIEGQSTYIQELHRRVALADALSRDAVRENVALQLRLNGTPKVEAEAQAVELITGPESEERDG